MPVILTILRASSTFNLWYSFLSPSYLTTLHPLSPSYLTAPQPLSPLSLSPLIPSPPLSVYQVRKAIVDLCISFAVGKSACEQPAFYRPCVRFKLAFLENWIVTFEVSYSFIISRITNFSLNIFFNLIF